MKKIILVLTASAVLSGCVSSQQQIDSHAPALTSWVGAPIDEFLDMHGTPTEMIDESDYQVYRFRAGKTRGVNLPDSEYCEPTESQFEPKRCHSTTGAPWYTVTYGCVYGLLVVENVIKDWDMNGNSCRMMSVSYRPN